MNQFFPASFLILHPSSLIMRVNEFLHLTAETTRSHLPARRRNFQTRTFYTFIQLYYTKRGIHYEVQVRGQARQIEVGLHFEADRETNSALLRYFSDHIFEVKDTLGTQVEAEQWTASWTRIHELMPYSTLDEATAFAVAERLAQMIETLQPMLEHTLSEKATRPANRKPKG